RRFAADGYYVVAPDLFYRSGEKLSFDFTRVSDPAYRQQLMEVVSSVTPERALADVEAMLSTVADDPAAAAGPRVSVGYCTGARPALPAAARRPGQFVAVAGIPPGALATDQPDSPHLELADVSAELYFAFAENDQSATAESVDLFRAEMEREGVAGVV